MFRSTTVLSAAVAAAFMAAAPAQADSTRCAFDFAAAARGRASGLTLDRDRTPRRPRRHPLADAASARCK